MPKQLGPLPHWWGTAGVPVRQSMQMQALQGKGFVQVHQIVQANYMVCTLDKLWDSQSGFKRSGLLQTAAAASWWVA